MVVDSYNGALWKHFSALTPTFTHSEPVSCWVRTCTLESEYEVPAVTYPSRQINKKYTRIQSYVNKNTPIASTWSQVGQGHGQAQVTEDVDVPHVRRQQHHRRWAAPRRAHRASFQMCESATRARRTSQYPSIRRSCRRTLFQNRSSLTSSMGALGSA